MKGNKVKERLILLGGTIGIGTISFFITLMVYNIQIAKVAESKKVEDTKIVYNNNLTEEQRKVAENLLAELEKLEQKSSTNKFEEEKDINLENDEKIQNNTEKNLIQEDNIMKAENDINVDAEEIDVIETIAKSNKKISFLKPVEGDIGMNFSNEKLIYSKTLNEWLVHKGIDILANKGTDVRASADGIIKNMYKDTRFGFTIVIEHSDEYVTKYSGIEENKNLKIGMSVKQGDVISQISASSGFEIDEGSHLHFEVLKDDINIEPEFILE